MASVINKRTRPACVVCVYVCDKTLIDTIVINNEKLKIWPSFSLFIRQIEHIENETADNTEHTLLINKKVQIHVKRYLAIPFMTYLTKREREIALLVQNTKKKMPWKYPNPTWPWHVQKYC